MKGRFGIGLALAVLFTLVNVGGGIYAGAMGEVPHAGLHGVLALVGAYVTWLILVRRRTSAALHDEALAADGPPRELASRLTNLEQSIDAIAVEVERVGEGQRYMTNLFADREKKRDGA